MSLYRKVLEKMKNITGIQKESGSILVLTALLLPIMFGCLGIAYDVGNIYMHKARLQNVADAAALAGGRAFLLSQAKTSETEHKDTYDTYTNGNSTDEEYVIGGSKTRSGNHPDADKAADDYIYKNIINLGEKVYSDKFSHYALPGLKKNGEDYINDSKIFYRIGLYEKLPLHFLPVITNKNVETVRAGSVVVVEPGTTTVVPGGDETISSYSIFDNLFTYSNSFFTDQSSKYNEGWVKMAFVGDMVYTHGNTYNDNFYTAGDTNLAQHYYNNYGTNVIEGNAIDDPVINTVFDIERYIPAFQNKLRRPHIDAYNQSKTVKASEINNYSSYLYKNYTNSEGEILKIDNKQVYRNSHNLDEIYVNEGDDKWLIDPIASDPTHLEYMYITVKDHNDQDLNLRIGYKKIGDTYYKVAENPVSNSYHSYYLLSSTNEIIANNTALAIINNNNQLRFDPLPSGFNFGLISVNPDRELRYSNNKWQYKHLLTGTWTDVQVSISEPFADNYFSTDSPVRISNIFHISASDYPSPCYGKMPDGNVQIIFDEELKGDINTPIYIILEGGMQQLNWSGSADTRRPVIIAYLDQWNGIHDQGYSGDFKGIIYAPKLNENVHLHFSTEGQTFTGNIITRNIKIDSSNGANIKYVQHNYLENPDYTDSDIATVTAEVRAENQDYSFGSLSEEIQNDILTTLQIDADKLGDMNYYNNLSYNEKQQFFRRWKELYNKYKNNIAARNVLWPWNEYFSTNGSTDTSGELLRLINYRTEFQMKDDLQNDDVLDPFIFETLAKPNSY